MSKIEVSSSTIVILNILLIIFFNMLTVFQRSIRLSKVMALSKSTEANNKEFVVHVRGEYDYRFICEMRDDMFEQIKACFFHLMNENLPVFGVPGKLK